MNQFRTKCSAIFGLPPNFSIADVPQRYQGSLAVLTPVVATTLSAAVAVNCHGVQVVPVFSVPSVTCDIELYQVDSVLGDQLVKSWTGVNDGNQAALYAGNLEMVDLNCLPIKVKVINPVGGSVAIDVRKTY